MNINMEREVHRFLMLRETMTGEVGGGGGGLLNFGGGTP